MRPRLLSTLPLVLVLCACGSGADKRPPPWNPYSALPPRDENYHGGPGSTLKKYDANKDGILTRDELVAGLKADFAAADTAKTGCLSDSEVAAINQARIAADQSTATPLQDWNQDGCVDFQEFATAPASLFDELDLNHDGKLTARELEPTAGRGGRGQTQSDQDSQGGRRGRGGRGGGRGGGDGGDGAPPPGQ